MYWFIINKTIAATYSMLLRTLRQYFRMVLSGMVRILINNSNILYKNIICILYHLK